MNLRARLGHIVRTIIATAGAPPGIRADNVTAIVCPTCHAVTVNPIARPDNCVMCGTKAGDGSAFERYDLPSGTAIWTGGDGTIRARGMGRDLLINRTKKRGVIA